MIFLLCYTIQNLLSACVPRLHSPSKRFCSFFLRDQSGSSTVMICVYLPTNDGSPESHLITLGELEGFIDRHKYDHLIITGDFNADFGRDNANLRHLSDLSLVSADLPFHSSIQYTYMRDDGGASSWPDHFLSDSSLAGDLALFRRLDLRSNKDPAFSDNYRPIALAPTLSKALQWCILLLHPDQFLTSGLQFGFKPKVSSSLCTGTLKNVISHFIHEGSPIFSCFLGASKGFDLINHEILFRRLLEKDFS